jgi:phosphatidylglycerophosphate synthase
MLEGAPTCMTMPTFAPFERFSRVNALVMLLGCAAALALERASLFVFAGFSLLAALIWVSRGRYTPGGSFGLGNGVTVLRSMLAGSIGLVPPSVPGWALGGIVVVVFALDGLDGWIAARRGETSEFGAHFDMETDAFLVLLIGIVLYLRGRYGWWILGAGLLRYAYVLCLALVPARSGHQPRWAHGRHAFTSLMVGLSLGMVLGDPFGTVAAALGSGLVGASFAYSFYWSYARGG